MPSPTRLSEARYAETLRAGLATGAFASKGERTRYRLRIAAAEALEADGFQKLKVADVCRRANVALGTFYVYFRDKTEIAIDVVMSFIDLLYEQAREGARGANEYDSIYRTNLFFVLAYRANPGLMRCHVQLQSQEPEFRAHWEPRHRTWLEILARSILRRSEPGRLTRERALKIAAALEGMVFNYLYSAAVTRESLIESDSSDPAEMAETLSVLWYRGVHGRDPDHLRGTMTAHDPEIARS
ncbi:MAG: hypothetical protein Kilf2KO_11080 [Rhodospirillales bacterium]